MAPLTQSVFQLGVSSVSDNQRPPQLPYLYPEIIILIAERLLDIGRPGDLAALSLLQRSLFPNVQRILFRSVEIQTVSRCRRLMQTLRSEGTAERRDTLSSLIRNIRATLNTQPAPGEQLFTARDLIALFALCPELRHITLAGGHDGGPGEQLFPDIIDLHRLGTLTSVRSLTLSGPPGHLGPSLLLFLPNLEELRLFGDTPVSQFTGSSPTSGNSLRRTTWGLTSPPTLELIRWLFANSEEAIEGDLTLITTPVSSFELARIREYASLRGLSLRSTVEVAGTSSGQT